MDRWNAKRVAVELHKLAASHTKWPRPKPSAGQWVTNCPGHLDKTPSLSVRDTPNGIMVYCHGQCSKEHAKHAVEEALNIWLSTGLSPEDSKAEYKAQQQANKGARETPKAPAAHDAEPAKRIRYGVDRMAAAPFSSVPVREVTQYDARTKKDFTIRVELPLPDGIELTEKALTRNSWGAPTRIWTYRDAQGRPVSHIVRYEPKSDEKIVRPWIYASRDGRKPLWMPHALPEPRPLYNLNVMAEDPTKPLVVGEGEKVADAALHFFPEWIPTTSQGGTNAVHMTDWRPLKGRIVILACDFDSAGFQYGATVAQFARDTGAKEVRVIRWPTAWRVENGELVPGPYVLQPGDDLADHKARGWTRDLLKEALRRTRQPLSWKVMALEPDLALAV